MNRTLLLFSLLIMHNPAEAQLFDWAIGLGSTGYDTVESIDTDNAGNIYVAGRFENTMDADPGDGVSDLVSLGSYDVYVAKYSLAGALIWALSVGGPQTQYPSEVVFYNNALYITGAFRNTVDFDPGPAADPITSAGDEDIFLMKLTNDGGYLWTKTVGGAGEDHPDGLSLDNDGNMILCGLYSGTVDFDPNAGTSNLTSSGSQDCFLMKLDATGTLEWAYSIGTPEGEFCYDVETDAAGNVFACGLFYGTLDFEPGPGSFPLVAGNNYSQCFLLKWTTDGVFAWAGMFGGSQSDSAYDLTIDDTGAVIVTGYFNGNGDFDPGAGVFTLLTESSLFYADLFILKLMNDGTFDWALGIGVNGSLQTGYAVDTKSNGNICVTGMYDAAVDFDPGAGVNTLTNYGIGDAFILELNEQGDFLYAGHVGGSQGDFGSAIVYTTGGMVAGGSFSWSGVDLDPGDDTFLVTSTSFSNDGFVIGLSSSEECTTETCAGDFDADSVIGVMDLMAFIAAYQCNSNCCPYDLTNDGLVSVTDLISFIGLFGSICP
ncbi:MAG: hypothetical protein ACKVOR_10560 [Flavobacteriales bacterium]